MYKFSSFLLSVVTLFLACALSASAQNNDAILTGLVLDPMRAVVAGAKVRLWQEASGFEQSGKTDQSGRFHFEHLIEGEYRLSVTGEGFAVVTREVRLAAGESLRVELTLQLASIAQEMVVQVTHIVDVLESVKRIPGSVEVLDPKFLETSRVFTATEALRKVTGLNVRDEEGFGLRPNIGIRGLNPTRSSKVLLLEDGIPLAYAPYGDNASYYHPPVDRFESIEVVKGSGQILYGPMTVGGVVNYITPAPPVKPSGRVTLFGGSRDYFNGHISYGGTWDNTSVLLDLMHKQGEGARENVRSALNDFNLKLVTSIGSKQALTLRGNYYSEDSNVTYSGLREDEYRRNPRQNPFRNDFFYGDRYGASATHVYMFNTNLLLTTNLYGTVFQRHWWRQSSNSNQRPNDVGDPACGGMANLNTTCGNEGRLRRFNTWGLEPRFRVSHQLFGLKNETDFGARAHFEVQDRRQLNGNRPTSRTGVTVEDNERRNEAYSAFIQNRFTLGKWALTPGLRLEHVRYERTNRLANAGAGVTGRTDVPQVIPGLGLSYSPVERVTLFGGIHRGFAPPRTEDIINNTTGGSIDLDPELSWNYELGVRALVAPGGRLEGTFFRMDYENQIIPASLAGGVGATFTNGGRTLHQGVELAGRLDVGTILRSRHNVYLRVAYTGLPTAKFVGTRFSNIQGFETVRITGNRLPYAPEHLLNAIVGYSHTRGVDLLLEAVRTSDQFGDDLNTVRATPDGQRGSIPAYAVWNGAANYRVESLGTTFFITVKNIFDRTFIVDRARGILPSSPRLLQAGLKFQF